MHKIYAKGNFDSILQCIENGQGSNSPELIYDLGRDLFDREHTFDAIQGDNLVHALKYPTHFLSWVGQPGIEGQIAQYLFQANGLSGLRHLFHQFHKRLARKCLDVRRLSYFRILFRRSGSVHRRTDFGFRVLAITPSATRSAHKSRYSWY